MEEELDAPDHIEVATLELVEPWRVTLVLERVELLEGGIAHLLRAARDAAQKIDGGAGRRSFDTCYDRSFDTCYDGGAGRWSWSWSRCEHFSGLIDCSGV